MLLDSPVPAGYALEVPEGWEAIERPGADIELTVAAPAIGRRATVLGVERFVRDEQTPPDAVDRLLTEHVEGLLAAGVDAMLLDVVVVDSPRGATAPGMRATVAYRHGPSTVTAFVWVFETQAGAYRLGATVDADLLAADGPVIEGIIASLDLAVGASAADAAVDAVPDAGDAAAATGQGAPDLTTGAGNEQESAVAGAPVPAELPAPPAGWSDADGGGLPAPRRYLVRDATAGTLPVTLSAARLDEPTGDVVAAHERAVDELAVSLTDATLLAREPSVLAGAPGLCSSIWFRHGAGNRVADLWTSGQVVAWAISAAGDDEGRGAAAALVAGASLAQLGCEDLVLGDRGSSPESAAMPPLEEDGEGESRPYDGVSVALRIEFADQLVTALGVLDGGEIVFAVEGDPLGDGGPLHRPAGGAPIDLASLVALAPRPAPDGDATVLISEDEEVAASRAALLAGFDPELCAGTPLAAGDELVLWSAVASWTGADGEIGARAIVVADGGEHGIARVESVSGGTAITPCTSSEVWADLCALLPRPDELA